ncbi:MAG: MoaD family protein [Candidatus Methanomethylicia archaeon]
MGKVTIEVFLTLREKLGWSKKEVNFNEDHTTFKQLLDYTEDLKQYLIDEKREMARGYIILVNGRHIEFTGGLQTTLKDGDEIVIFPPSGGG